jgi:hypothetical protein
MDRTIVRYWSLHVFSYVWLFSSLPSDHIFELMIVAVKGISCKGYYYGTSNSRWPAVFALFLRVYANGYNISFHQER